MPNVTIGLSADELESLDAWALAEYDGDREAAVESLLEEWIEERR